MKLTKAFPVRIDLVTYAGDDDERTFGLRDPDGYTDTSGWTGRMQVRTDPDATTTILDSDAGDITLLFGIQGTAPDQYNVSILMHGTKTANLGKFVGWYDLEVMDMSGRRETLFHGLFRVEPDVTR